MQLASIQLATLSQSVESAFLNRALAYLCDKHPDLSRRHGPDRIRKILDLSHQRCRSHRVASENCVVTLADLSLTYSRDVYLSDGWVQEILSNEHIDVPEKALRLKSYL